MKKHAGVTKIKLHMMTNKTTVQEDKFDSFKKPLNMCMA